MYFSLERIRDAELVDTENGLNYNDYEIAFSDDRKNQIHPLVDNLISNETQTIKLSNKTLPLSYELFAKDACNDKHEKPGIDSWHKRIIIRLLLLFLISYFEFGQQKCGFRLPGTLARCC
jgi:hypothetical protein